MASRLFNITINSGSISTAAQRMGHFGGMAGSAGSSLDKLRQRFDANARSVSDLGLRLDSIAGNFKRLVSVTAAFSAALGTIKVSAKFETIDMALTTLIGDAEKTKQILSELKEFAIGTPFQYERLAESTRFLKAMNIETDQLLPTVKNISNAVAALGGSPLVFERIGLAIGQMKAKGVAQAQEFRQLAESGVNAWLSLAKGIERATGKTTSIRDAMDMVQKRMISGAEAANVILNGMTEQYGLAIEALMKTISGLFTALKDNIVFASRDIGDALVEGFDLKERLRESIGVIGVLRDLLVEMIRQLTGTQKETNAYTEAAKKLNTVLVSLAKVLAVLTALKVIAFLVNGAMAAGLILILAPLKVIFSILTGIAGLLATFVLIPTAILGVALAGYALGVRLRPVVDILTALAELGSEGVKAGKQSFVELGDSIGVIVVALKDGFMLLFDLAHDLGSGLGGLLLGKVLPEFLETSNRISLAFFEWLDSLIRSAKVMIDSFFEWIETKFRGFLDSAISGLKKLPATSSLRKTMLPGLQLVREAMAIPFGQDVDTLRTTAEKLLKIKQNTPIGDAVNFGPASVLTYQPEWERVTSGEFEAAGRLTKEALRSMEDIKAQIREAILSKLDSSNTLEGQARAKAINDASVILAAYENAFGENFRTKRLKDLITSTLRAPSRAELGEITVFTEAEERVAKIKQAFDALRARKSDADGLSAAFEKAKAVFTEAGNQLLANFTGPTSLGEEMIKLITDGLDKQAEEGIAVLLEKFKGTGSTLAQQLKDVAKEFLLGTGYFSDDAFGSLEQVTGAGDRLSDRLMSIIEQAGKNNPKLKAAFDDAKAYLKGNVDDIVRIFNDLRAQYQKFGSKKIDLGGVEQDLAALVTMPDAEEENKKAQRRAKDRLLEMAKEIDTKMRTAFLSPDARKRELELLKVEKEALKAFGDDALLAADAVALFDEKLQELEKHEKLAKMAESIKKGFENTFTSIIMGAEDASEAFRKLALSILEMTIRQYAIQPMLNSIFGDRESPGSNFLSNFFRSAGGALAGSVGRLFPRPIGPLQENGTFATGGIIDGPTAFRYGSNVGLMGEAGPEAIMPLGRGPNGKLGVMAGGGGSPVTVNMTVQTPDADSFRRSSSQLRRELSRMIK